MRPLSLIFFYLAMVLLPLILAGLSLKPPRSVLDELASGAGILAFAIILVEFILSGRFHSISDQVGMDATMRFHQLLARSALVLAMVHPFLYRAPFSYQRPWDTTQQLTLTENFEALTSGLFAWVLLLVLVIFAITRDQLPFKYETWRLMHGVGAALVAIFILHHTMGMGRYSRDPLLATVWLVLFSVALVSLFYVYLAKPMMRLRRPWRTTSLKPLALKTWELVIEPVGHTGLKFNAGQFVWLNVGNSVFSLKENPFSISSAPAEGQRLEFVIKELGDFTNAISKTKRGTKVFVDGPYGNLFVSDRSEPGVALIAGGVGIAPILSILRQLHHDKDKRPTLLVYGNRVEEQLAYGDEIAKLVEEHGTKLVRVLSQPTENWTGYSGLIDATLIQEIFKTPEMKQWLFVLCGPPVMMENIEAAIIDLDVPSNQILSERFTYD